MVQLISSFSVAPLSWFLPAIDEMAKLM